MLEVYCRETYYIAYVGSDTIQLVWLQALRHSMSTKICQDISKDHRIVIYINSNEV